MEGTEILGVYRRPPIAIKLHTDDSVMTISLMLVVICIHLARRCVSTTPELKYVRTIRETSSLTIYVEYERGSGFKTSFHVNYHRHQKSTKCGEMVQLMEDGGVVFIRIMTVPIN